LIGPPAGEPVDVENVFPVVHIDDPGIDLNRYLFGQSPGSLNGNIQPVIPGQPAFIERAVKEPGISVGDEILEDG
jgi:hypothetical protein